LFHLIEANIVRKYNYFKSVALFIWDKVEVNGLEFTISIEFAQLNDNNLIVNDLSHSQTQGV